MTPVNDMDAQEHAMSGLDTRDQQEAEAAAEEDYTFYISKSEFVHHIADAYKAGKAAGQQDILAQQHIDNPLTNLPELFRRAAEADRSVEGWLKVSADLKRVTETAQGWIEDAMHEASAQCIDPAYEAARADQPEVPPDTQGAV